MNLLHTRLSFLIWFNILHTSFFASNQYYSIQTPMDQTVQEGMSNSSMMPCLLHNLHKILNISYPTWNSKCFYLGQFYCHLWSILKFAEVCLSVCLCVCSFFWPTSQCPIEPPRVCMESLHHSGENKTISNQIGAKIFFVRLGIIYKICLFVCHKCLFVCHKCLFVCHKCLFVCHNQLSSYPDS